MGCDIHFYVEKRDAETGNWTLVDELVREGEGEDAYVSTNYHQSFYNGRNYNLFAILADVRNGRGFAGIKTGEGFQPISEPRGVPEDASDGYIELVEQYGGDGHSHSFHTIRQLLDYDWTQTTQLQGWTAFPEWMKWSRWDRKEGKGPRSYSGGVSGQGIQHVELEAMDALVEQFSQLDSDELRGAFMATHGQCYALAKWGEPYHTSGGEFFATTIPRLLALAGGTVGLDDVRCVFFFDN